MTERVVADVSHLPTYGFGSRSTPWWGTLGFIALEGTGFALAAGTYLYLMHRNDTWPLSAAPPNHWPGTLLTLLLLLSLWPNLRLDRDARGQALGPVRRGLVLMSAVGFLAIGVRFYEFAHLNVNWDSNAYGSITWFLLGLHATHLITDVGDTLVLTVLMFTRHATGRRFSDCSDNAFYWYFVVFSWLPMYGLIYWAPRM